MKKDIIIQENASKIELSIRNYNNGCDNMKENHHRLCYKVEIKFHGMTIKEILRGKYSMSTRFFKTIKDQGFILLNNKKTKWHKTAWQDDILTIEMGEEDIDAAPNPIPIDIIYEDSDVLVINKASNTVVHPTKGHIYDTLANGISYYWGQKGISCKIRFVNRLDKDTSGLILVAKNKFAHHNIQMQMKEQMVKKRYWAFTEGILNQKQGMINAPIGLASEEDIRRKILKEGQVSITHYKVIQEYRNASWIKVGLETGRTHQIRVHMDSIGHPLIGDSLYNAEGSEYIERQALHARILGFTLPRTGEYKEFKASLPQDMMNLKRRLEND